jgi:hypothetical protein
MRPVSTSQSSLQYPLNNVLGRESHVRILRLLADQIEPVGISLIAEHTGLTVAGTRKAVLSLLSSGYLEEIGSDRQRQYSIRFDDSLSRAIIELFAVERKSYNNLVGSLKDVISNLEIPPDSVWIEPVEGESSKHIELGFLAPVKEVAQLKNAFRQSLFEVESAHDVSIELEGYTGADVAFLDTNSVTIIYGRSPQATKGELSEAYTQKDMDDRARAWATALAKLVRDDPTLIPRARHWLEDTLVRGAGTATADTQEWLRILTSYSKQQIMEFLISESPRAHRLRQSSPFAVVLDEAQRDTLNQKWQEFQNDI